MSEEYMAVVEDTFNPEGDTTGFPFGKRWGGNVFKLTREHLEALYAGKAIALDVMHEYLTFVVLENPKNGAVPPAPTFDGGLGGGAGDGG